MRLKLNQENIKIQNLDNFQNGKKKKKKKKSN